MKSEYTAIGVMAGSSMDGLDVVKVSLSKNGKWEYEFLKSKTYTYDSSLYSKLKNSSESLKKEQLELDLKFGQWIAKCLLDFGISKTDLIAVHGHTVIHDPDARISWQLGSGEEICKATEKVVVSDFRNEDVQKGGQGAPLVPIGDFDLFSEYDACLNLGGIANISIAKTKEAWDICPCNQVLNFYAEKMGKSFDHEGIWAREGEANHSWMQKIKSMDFFNQGPPKSLPNNFISSELLNETEPLVGLSSFTELVSELILKDCSNHLSQGSMVLTTGGGAHNKFLLELLNKNSNEIVFKPGSEELTEYKEALVFAFLGVLRVRNEVNTLASVSGAFEDSCSGTIHYPK